MLVNSPIFLLLKLKCFNPEPKLLNAVLTVRDRGSTYSFPAIRFWFLVYEDTSKNRTKLNLGAPTGASMVVYIS